MVILVDRGGVESFTYRTSSAEWGDVRRYCCARAPVRAVLVCRNGLELHELAGQVVDAQVGDDAGWRDFVREGNAGKVHTKVTVYRRVSGARAERSLAVILARAPRDAEGQGDEPDS